MLVSLDIKFIRRDQKHYRNGEACRASPTWLWSNMINLISKDTYMVFYLSCMISRFNGKKAITQVQFYSNMISHDVIIPLLSGEFCSRCMIKPHLITK